MVQGGLIRDLVNQPRFRLEVKGTHICDYIADFSYRDARQGTVIVEDTKGFRTQLFRIKKKLMAACLSIEITET